jgi:WD40 repeat protein
MKTNLSVDVEYFKNQVEILRKKLNKCQTDGILDEGFEEQLNKLFQIEEELLTQLIPYYRVYVDNIKKTSMEVNPTKQLGAFGFDSFLESISRINENLFITASVDRSVQFFYIDICDDVQIEVEWSAPIKEIKERISFIYKLNDKEILLFGAIGGCYLISSDNLKKIPDVNGQIEVKKIGMDSDFDGFGRCLAINDDLFVVENGEEKLSLFEIIKEKDEYQLIFHEDIYCSVSNWATMEKISDNYFVVGTKTGRLYFIKYRNKQFIITEEMDFLNDEIRKISFLENEDGKKDSLIVVGNKGQLKIFSLYEDEKIIKMEIDDLKGNLFDVQSKKGTAVVLSEDGMIYLFEENFGNWDLNEESTIKDVFFTNVLKLDISKYLLMDIAGKLKLLDINRINTPKDLWNLPLYQ